MTQPPVRLAVFGSTGSIGKSCLEIVSKYRDRFEVVSLVANTNVALLEEQIRQFKPKYAGLSDSASAVRLKNALSSDDVRIFSGPEISELAGFDDYDVLVAAIVGFSGLESVLTAARAGKKIALANKESLVAAGELVLSEVKKHSATLIPVDSEHSAIFQLLGGNDVSGIKDITITASGGPFLKRELKDFNSITPAEAIKHPRWQMGNKISLDSATMFNKALELMEAKWLFGLSPEQISIVVHPQSIVHALINFTDGTSYAHLSNTDMKGAIAYALTHPNQRLPAVLEKLELEKLGTLEFCALDSQKFPAVELARRTFTMGRAAGAVFNSANEYAGAAFLTGKIPFLSIYSWVNDALSQFGSLNYSSYQDLLAIDQQVREYLSKVIK